MTRACGDGESVRGWRERTATTRKCGYAAHNGDELTGVVPRLYGPGEKVNAVSPYRSRSVWAYFLWVESLALSARETSPRPAPRTGSVWAAEIQCPPHRSRFSHPHTNCCVGPDSSPVWPRQKIECSGRTRQSRSTK